MMPPYLLSLVKHAFWGYFFKTLDTFCNCQRPLFSFAVSDHICTKKKKKNVNILAQLVIEVARYVIMEEKTPNCHTKLCAVRCLSVGPQNLILRSLNQTRGKLPWKLSYFRGSHFSQCFIILSTSPHYSLPSMVSC